VTTCPECAQNKCRNCDSTAWDFDTDLPAACTCWADDHGGAA